MGDVVLERGLERIDWVGDMIFEVCDDEYHFPFSHDGQVKVIKCLYVIKCRDLIRAEASAERKEETASKADVCQANFKGRTINILQVCT